MSKSKIEWCDHTWNPVTGCTQISPGCANCYAKRMSERFAGPWGLDLADPFKVALKPERLEEPLRWKKPSKVFVCSMSDLFHDDVPDDFIYQVFNTIASSRQHTYLILTKRPERMQEIMEMVKDLNFCTLPNVWLGVTAENQKQADRRIPILLQIPAAKRFVSVEPMLGPVNLTSFWVDGGVYHPLDGDMGVEGRGHCAGPKLDWVICGGESGPGARPMHPDWARSLRDQCKAAGTPFLFKQWGEWEPRSEWAYEKTPQVAIMLDGSEVDDDTVPQDVGGHRMFRVGKKAAGRLLDGELWDQYPET